MDFYNISTISYDYELSAIQLIYGLFAGHTEISKFQNGCCVAFRFIQISDNWDNLQNMTEQILILIRGLPYKRKTLNFNYFAGRELSWNLFKK